MKRIISFIAMFIIVTVFSGTTAFAKSTVPKITVNNKEIKFSVQPYIKGSEVVLPVRQTVEALGAKVEYVKKSNSVLIDMDNTRIELPIGKKEFYIYKDNGKRQTFKLSIAITREKGITYIEGKKFFECLGISVKWDIKKKIFTITKPEKIDLTKDIPYTVITRDDIKNNKNLSKWYDDNYKKAGIRYKKDNGVMYVLIGAGKRATGGYTVGIEKISYKTEKKA